MHDFLPPTLHVRRRLTERELATIAGALAHFTRTLTIEEQIVEMAPYNDEPLSLSPEQALALARELVDARKVKVCRSKHKPA